MTKRTRLWLTLSILSIAAVILIAALAPMREVGFLLQNARLGTAVVANDLCYGVFLQGRSEESVRSAELGPIIDPRLAWASARVDLERGTVGVSLLGLFSSQATQRGDGSCQLGLDPPEQRLFRAPIPDPAPWPDGDAMSPETVTSEVDMEALRQAVAEEFLPTAGGVDRGTRSVLVVHRGRLIHQQHADGWDGLVPQNGRSMSKVLGALLAGSLVAEEIIDLDQSDLRPEWQDQRKDISIRALLLMQSGLQWHESNGPGNTATAQFIAANAADFIASKPVEKTPGTRFHYSGGDSDLLMSILQEQAGLDDQAWWQYLQVALWEPMGMRQVVVARDRSGKLLSSSGMHASALDWARLGLFLARDGVSRNRRILPAGWVDFMRTATAESGCNYGAMVWIRGGCQSQQPSPVFELSGFMGQGVTVIPETETVIVRTGFGPWIMGDLLERIFPALGIHAPSRMAMESRPNSPEH